MIALNAVLQRKSLLTEEGLSFVETAEDRIDIIKEITERNCNFVFEDYYTSLLELLQALVISE